MAARRIKPPVQIAKPSVQGRAIDARFACFRLRAGRSGIEGTGVYAREPIPARRKVIEYTGEKINMREAVRRLRGRHYHYIFRVSRRSCLDGRIGGSGAQLVNHCCDPNLFAWITKGHILLMSRRRIRTGEELTLDYKYAADTRLVSCKCGSPRCRGTINRKSGKERRWS